MTDRVDKSWKSKGLAGYGDAAIIGTLRHYGVASEEGQLRESLHRQSPSEVAASWLASWRGTGQFASFPFAAADELAGRWWPEQVRPSDVATALDELLHLMTHVTTGELGEPTEAADALERLVARLPPSSERLPGFMPELESMLPHPVDFTEEAVELAKHNHLPFATRVAALSESVFPDYAGCLTALVASAGPERSQALAALVGLVDDKKRSLAGRWAALESLFATEDNEALKSPALSLFDEAASAGDWRLADEVAHLMAEVVRRTSSADRAWALEVSRRLDESHAHVDAHHHHHHH